MTIGVSIVHFVIKVPTLVQVIVTIYRVQSSIHCQSKMTAKYTIWPPRNLVILIFQHQTTVISRASSRSPCYYFFFILVLGGDLTDIFAYLYKQRSFFPRRVFIWLLEVFVLINQTYRMIFLTTYSDKFEYRRKKCNLIGPYTNRYISLTGKFGLILCLIQICQLLLFY